MKLFTLSVLAASLLLGSFAVSGCTNDVAEEEIGDAEDVGTTEDALSAGQIRGDYVWLADLAEYTEFESLSLKSAGRFSAMVQAPANVQCVAFPCTVPVSGTWSTYKVGGIQKLRLKPTGRGARIYSMWFSFGQKSLRLTRFGATTKLFKEPVLTCAAVLCAPNSTCKMTAQENKPAKAECVPTTPPPNDCVKTGCSSQLCADEHRISTCEFRPEYACYWTATCERQADGSCGWTETTELTNCLESSR